MDVGLGGVAVGCVRGGCGRAGGGGRTAANKTPRAPHTQPSSLPTQTPHKQNTQERFYFSDGVLPLFESGIPMLLQRLNALPDRRDVTIAYPDEGAWKRFHYSFRDEGYPEIICTKVFASGCLCFCWLFWFWFWLCFVFFFWGGGGLCLLAWLGWCAAVLNHIHCNHPSNEHTKQKTLKKVRDGAKRIVRLKEGEPSGRHVVIVDDLVQSGGTLIECHALLASLGAKHGEERQERRGGCCCSCCFQPRPVPRTALAQNATRTPRRSSQARAAHTPYGRWPLRPWHSNACARAAQGASTWVASRFGWQCPPTQPLARIPFSPPCFSKGEQRRRRRQQPFLARGAPPFYFPPRPRAGRSAAYTYTYLKHTPVSLSHTTHPSKTPTKTTKTNECKSERVRDARRLPQGVVQQVQARRRRCVRVC